MEQALDPLPEAEGSRLRDSVQLTNRPSISSNLATMAFIVAFLTMVCWSTQRNSSAISEHVNGRPIRRALFRAVVSMISRHTELVISVKRCGIGCCGIGFCRLKNPLILSRRVIWMIIWGPVVSLRLPCPIYPNISLGIRQ